MWKDLNKSHSSTHTHTQTPCWMPASWYQFAAKWSTTPQHAWWGKNLYWMMRAVCQTRWAEKHHYCPVCARVCVFLVSTQEWVCGCKSYLICDSFVQERTASLWTWCFFFFLLFNLTPSLTGKWRLRMKESSKIKLQSIKSSGPSRGMCLLTTAMHICSVSLLLILTIFVLHFALLLCLSF